MYMREEIKELYINSNIVFIKHQYGYVYLCYSDPPTAYSSNIFSYESVCSQSGFNRPLTTHRDLRQSAVHMPNMNAHRRKIKSAWLGESAG